MPLIARVKPGIDVGQAESVLQSVFREHMSLPETQGIQPDPRWQAPFRLAAPRGERSQSTSNAIRITAHCAHEHGRRSTAHRVRQCGEPALRPRHRARQRSGHPHVGRRQPPATRATVPDREPRPRGRWRARSGPRRLGHTICRGIVSRESEPDRHQCSAGRRRVVVRHGALGVDRHSIRSDTGIRCDARQRRPRSSPGPRRVA